MSELTREEIIDHVTRYLDDRLDAPGGAALAEALAASAATRAQFVELCTQARLLHEALAGARIVDEPAASKWRIGRWAVAAAALLALTAGLSAVWMNLPVSHARHAAASNRIALVTDMHDVVFAGGADESPQLGSPMQPGLIQLASGQVQFMFDSGAVVTIDGPCAFNLHDKTSGYLAYGRLQAYVPHEAVGFRIDTASGVSVVDLGTEFGIDAQQDGRTSVEVYRGRVQLQRGGEAGRVLRELAAGSSAQFDTRGVVTIASLPLTIASIDFHRGGSAVSPNEADVDAYPGRAAEGWASAWGVTTTPAAMVETGPVVRSDRPLNATSGSYLTMGLRAERVGEPAQGTVSRCYMAGLHAMDAARPHRISFLFRAEAWSDPMVRYFIYDRPSPSHGTDGEDTWILNATPDAGWTLMTRTSPDSAEIVGVPTGIPLVTGRTVAVEIQVDPAHRAWTATLDDGVNPVYRSPRVYFRSQAPAVGRFVHFGGRDDRTKGTDVVKQWAFSVDELRVTASSDADALESQK
ncbi:MAG: hypothetical protein GC162_00235 [Planctomycetes bacterium]|nr:hypothetical protein [Planctomycetota bacterium]